MTHLRNKTSFIRPALFAIIPLAILVTVLLYLTTFPAEFPAAPRAADAGGKPSESLVRPQRTWKILHVMSYHSPWKWTDDQFAGFQAALKDLEVDWQVMQMDTKRRSDEAFRQRAAAEVRETIRRWQPDLVFTGDDDVQRYVTTDFVNTEVPFVFCAVNADPADYGFVGSTNVTGVLERMHYTATLRLLKKLAPTVRTAVMLSDRGTMWPPMIERMKEAVARYPEIEIVRYDILDTFEEFQAAVLDYQDDVDAIGFFGVFEFLDAEGNNMPMEEVLRWFQAHNRLPDFSFWRDRVDKGTLCAVTVSGYAQGYQAGLMAREILLGGKSPAVLPMRPTEKGIPVISLEAAQRLGIRPDADVLLTAEVVRSNALHP